MGRKFDPTSIARTELGIDDILRWEARARSEGVYIVASWSFRRGCWRVVVTAPHQKSAELFGKGSLDAVIEGCIEDFRALQDDEDGPPPDIDRESLPEFNGAFR